jgi:hypothetical protein
MSQTMEAVGAGSTYAQFASASRRTAVEMSVPWKSQNDFHRTLEISYQNEDFHIPTADLISRENEDNISDGCAPSRAGPEYVGCSGTSPNEQRRGCRFVSLAAITNHTFLIETLPSVHASSTATRSGGTA